MRIQLVRAWPHRYEQVAVEVAADARVEDALAAAGWTLGGEFTALAIFSQPATGESLLHPGDCIELLRELRLDPMQARRRRAARR